MLDQPNRPTGKFFTEIYKEMGEPLRNSARFRTQLQGGFEHFININNVAELNLDFRAMAGIAVPRKGYIRWLVELSKKA